MEYLSHLAKVPLIESILYYLKATLSGLILARLNFADFADFGFFCEIKSARNVEFAQNMPKNKGKLSKIQRIREI